MKRLSAEADDPKRSKDTECPSTEKVECWTGRALDSRARPSARLPERQSLSRRALERPSREDADGRAPESQRSRALERPSADETEHQSSRASSAERRASAGEADRSEVDSLRSRSKRLSAGPSIARQPKWLGGQAIEQPSDEAAER